MRLVLTVTIYKSLDAIAMVGMGNTTWNGQVIVEQ